MRIPGSKNSFAAGEIFIFLLLLMHGPSAAVLAAAGEALVGSMRSSKRWTSRLVSPALAAIAMGVAGNTLHAALQGLRALGMLNEVVLLVVAMTFAIGYFLLNTSLITVIPHLKRNEPMRLSTLMALRLGRHHLRRQLADRRAAVPHLPASGRGRADRRRCRSSRCCW